MYGVLASLHLTYWPLRHNPSFPLPCRESTSFPLSLSVAGLMLLLLPIWPTRNRLTPRRQGCSISQPAWEAGVASAPSRGHRPVRRRERGFLRRSMEIQTVE